MTPSYGYLISWQVWVWMPTSPSKVLMYRMICTVQPPRQTANVSCNVMLLNSELLTMASQDVIQESKEIYYFAITQDLRTLLPWLTALESCDDIHDTPYLDWETEEVILRSESFLSSVCTYVLVPMRGTITSGLLSYLLNLQPMFISTELPFKYLMYLLSTLPHLSIGYLPCLHWTYLI